MLRKKQIRKPVQSWLLFSPWFHETNKLEKLWDNWSNDITWRKQQELAGQWQWKAIKQCWKTTKKLHPPVQLHKVMGTALKESLSEKDMKEIISEVASLCSLWAQNGKVHTIRAQNYSGYQGSPCFFRFGMKDWISLTLQCSKNRDVWRKEMPENKIFDNQD